MWVGTILSAATFLTLIWVVFAPQRAGDNLSSPEQTANASETSIASAIDPSAIRAIGFRHPGTGDPIYFLSIQETTLFFPGLRVRVLCPRYGTGETIVETNGTITAVNAAARTWVKFGFWAVKGRQLLRINDSGLPNDVPAGLRNLVPHLNEILQAGSEMCPMPSPVVETALKFLSIAARDYARNAKELGVKLP
ncbi:hypothetical protein A4A58_04680 [Tardiphaga robiniae]|uniref:Uncharacterized protein n=1 Tax=Tardiphaga robiniae TaxID=943830 RepID=A0A164B370_9BRAD|nr:hypothetical protein A4A58_04680 [Tardiphaga robiniae]